MAFTRFRTPDPSHPLGKDSAPVHSPAARRSFLIAAGFALVALVLGAAAARADSVAVDVFTTGNWTIYQGSSTVWNYRINALTGGTDQPDCNASDGTPAVVTIVAPPAVTVTPRTLTFTQCGVFQPVTVSSSTLGHYLVSPTVADAGGGSYNIGPSTVFLDVVAPPNTPPSVTVTGVADGASYEVGAVPPASCLVEDAEDGTFTVEPTIGAITGDQAALGVGSQTASCAYTDRGGLGAGAVATYQIRDTQPPVLTLPSDLVFEATGPDGAAIEYAVTASDAVDPAPVVECAPASGTTLELGTYAVSCTADDALANGVTGGFNVSVVDTTPPVFAGVPDDPTIEATGPTGATVDFAPPTATDLVDGPVAVTCEPTAGASFPLGETVVTCRASDGQSNEATAGFTVTVVDTTAPVLTLPADFAVQASDAAGTVVEFAASAVDQVDGDLPVACDPASGSHFPLDETTVSCVATDEAGNQASGAFVVTVGFVVASDTTPPTIVCGQPDGLWHATDVQIDCTATDDGGLAPDGAATLTFALTTAVPTGVETADASTDGRQVCDLAGNCAGAGPIGGNKVDKRAPSGISLTPNIPNGTVYVLLRLSPGGPLYGTLPAKPTCAALDDGSGVVSCTVQGYSARPGVHVLTITAVDAAGNVTVQYRIYAVVVISLYW